MFEKKRNLLTLGGVVRFRIINSPAYFNKLAKEAFSMFDSEEAQTLVAKVATMNINPNDPNLIPPVLSDKIIKLTSKYSVTGGIFNEFYDALVSFNPKDKIHIRHDVLAEITLKDGIVTKISRVPLPELFTQQK